MAKTFNLNPGSDATLVAAATRAAMANVPKDLSGTFESMAEEYGKTMREVGKSWAQVGKNLGTIGGQLADKAFKEIRTENENMGTLIEKEIEIEQPKEINVEGASYTYDDGSKQPESPYGSTGKLVKVTDFDKPESERKKEILTEAPTDVTAKPTPKFEKTSRVTTSLGQEMRSIRKELSSLYFKTDPKSSARKAELRKQKDKYYSEIAILKQENDVNNKLLADKNVNLEATGSLNLALNLAIKEYPTKGGKIKEGKYEGYSASLSRNEDGDLSWILKDPSGTLVTGMDSDQNLVTTGSKPYKVPISEMNKTLTPKMDQKVVDNANKIITTAFNSGKSGVDYMGNQLVSKFRTLLDDETSLQQLADVRLGDSPTTLREQFNSESVYSAEVFAGISSVDLQSMGVVDADGDKDVDKDDVFPKGGTPEQLQSKIANFKAVRSAIFDKNNDNYDDGRHLRSVTEKHIYNTGEIMHSVGNKLYRPPTDRTRTTTAKNPFGQKSIAFVPETGSTQYKTPAQALADRDAILSGTRFRGIYGDYEPTKGGFNLNGEFISTYDALTQEKVNLAGDRPAAGSSSSAPTPTYNPSDLAKLGGSETDDKALVGKFKNEYPEFKFDATTFDFGDKVKVTHKESDTTIKIPVSPTFYTDLANFMNNPTKKKLK